MNSEPSPPVDAVGMQGENWKVEKKNQLYRGIWRRKEEHENAGYSKTCRKDTNPGVKKKNKEHMERKKSQEKEK